jgi:hypothetical protein
MGRALSGIPGPVSWVRNAELHLMFPSELRLNLFTSSGKTNTTAAEAGALTVAGQWRIRTALPEHPWRSCLLSIA